MAAIRANAALLPLDRTTGPLARPRIGPCTLAAQRQTTAMANPPVATEIHQPLDIHGHFATKIAFDFKLLDSGT